MVTQLDQHTICSDLVRWGRQHTAPVQLCCVSLALNLERLIGEPNNLELRRETTRRIASLEEAVRTENAGSALGAEHRPPQMGQIASPVLAFVVGFLFFIYWNSTVANRSEPTMTSSIGTVERASPPTGSGSFPWVTRTD